MKSNDSSRYGKPLNCDTFAQREVLRLIRSHGIQSVLETGTYMADSTVWFATVVSSVLSMESNSNYAEVARRRLLDAKITNVKLVVGRSSDGIRDCGGGLPCPLLAFLDAHWGSHNPLLDELAALAGLQLDPKPVVVIHDFYVPGLGYDKFQPGVPISLELVRRGMNKLYDGEESVAWTVHTNSLDSAEGSLRGIGYFEPAGKPVQ